MRVVHSAAPAVLDARDAFCRAKPPKARNRVARGTGEAQRARSPWTGPNKNRRPGGPTEMSPRVCRPSGAGSLF